MSNIKKHVGRIKNTDRRCIVAMMQIPSREDHALVIDTDALPDRFHDALMRIVESPEGQSNLHLHTLLGRRYLPDTGMDMMNALHRGGHLRAVPVDNIVMYPMPHSPCGLRAIIEAMGNNVPVTEISEELQNRHLENQKLEKSDEQISLAKSLLMQAADLQNAANKKQEEAYRIAPSLRPTFGSTASMEDAVLPGELRQAVTEEVAVVSEDVAVIEHYQMPVVDTDVLDLPDDVAAAYQAALQAEPIVHEFGEDAAHAVDTSDDNLAAFLDRVAMREDKANKAAIEAAQPKRPVGRPRKDGTPAGSASE